MERRALKVEGVGEVEVKVSEAEGRLSFKLVGWRLVPELAVDGWWVSEGRAVLDVRPTRMVPRECEYGLIDVALEGDEALAVALVYDRTGKAERALKEALNFIEERLRLRGVRRLKLVKGTFRGSVEGYRDEGLYYVKELGNVEGPV
ncbi:MAG: hypothetical protein DRJ97_05650 [Thermoprotei archaeon]|nr:MAG: hypothetical protein DRJ97_05650 [Thermoprotei archaeon]